MTPGPTGRVFIHDGIIHFLNFPMPPSANKQLQPGSYLKKGRRVTRLMKTRFATDFDLEVEVFQRRHWNSINLVLPKIHEWVNNGHIMAMDLDFLFPYKQLISLEGEIKKVDGHNRMKATIDGASRILGVDDKFFLTHEVKTMVDRLYSVGSVNIRIMPTLQNLGFTRKPSKKSLTGIGGPFTLKG